jgi:phosphomannomutase
VLIRSISGVRGLTANEVTPDLARRYGRAFSRLAPGEIALGWDSRMGGDALKDAVAAGVVAGGGRVLDLGIVPTPTVGLVVRRRGLAGGVVVTASHNPEEYNGLKFFSSRGVFLLADEAAGLFEAVDGDRDSSEEGRSDPDADPGSSRRLDDAVGEHLSVVLGSAFVDTAAVAAARPRIVVDCVNAAGSVILPRLLRELGCEVVELSTDVGSGFPREAEPTPEHLGELSRAVVDESAAAGLACDPDADRLAIVDESGVAIGEELTLAIASRVVLERKRGALVANASTSRMMDDLALEFDVPIHRTPIGEINVVAKMEEVGAVVGGEGNGGVILPAIHMGRDAATAAALVVSGLASTESGRVSALAGRFKPYVSVKKKLTLPSVTREGIVDAMRGAFPEGTLDLTDGAKMTWPDRWIHARMSGTEPVVRVIAEAASEGDAEKLVQRAISAVTAAAEGA